MDRLAAEVAKASFLPQSYASSLVPRISPGRAIQIHELGSDLRSRLMLNGNLSLLLGYYCAELRNIMERTV